MNHNKLMVFNESSTLYCSLNSGDNYDDWKKFDPPLNNRFHGTEVLCCCDGLILLRVLSYPLQILSLCKPLEQTFILWNPTTGKYKLFSCFYVFNFAVAFGICYNSLADSYKVIILSQGKGSDIMVYDVKNEYWTTVNQPSYSILKGSGCRGVVANGMLHCVSFRSRDKSMVVVYFDFLEAEFKEVPQPAEFDHEDQGSAIGVAVVKGQLCIYRFTKLKQLKVWVMKEYGKKESWTNLIVIQIPSAISYLRVVTFTEKGEVVLELESNKLVIYNPSDNSFRTLSTHEFTTSWIVINHVESLLSLNNPE